jgi:hypothetical protein
MECKAKIAPQNMQRGLLLVVERGSRKSEDRHFAVPGRNCRARRKARQPKTAWLQGAPSAKAFVADWRTLNVPQVDAANKTQIVPGPCAA